LEPNGLPRWILKFVWIYFKHDWLTFKIIIELVLQAAMIILCIVIRVWIPWQTIKLYVNGRVMFGPPCLARHDRNTLHYVLRSNQSTWWRSMILNDRKIRNLYYHCMQSVSFSKTYLARITKYNNINYHTSKRASPRYNLITNC